MGVHGELKFFRFKHGDNEISAERRGNDSENEVFHKCGQSFSQPRAYSKNAAKNTTAIPM
jgi:hypothetical protein